MNFFGLITPQKNAACETRGGWLLLAPQGKCVADKWHTPRDRGEGPRFGLRGTRSYLEIY